MTDEIEEELNVLARFIGRAVNVDGDLDALEALTKVKSRIKVLEFAAQHRWERMEAAEEALQEISDYSTGQSATVYQDIARRALERSNA